MGPNQIEEAQNEEEEPWLVGMFCQIMCQDGLLYEGQHDFGCGVQKMSTVKIQIQYSWKKNVKNPFKPGHFEAQNILILYAQF